MNIYESFFGSAPQFFHSQEPLFLECGESLPELTLAYHTYGTLNAEADNVIWVCHALTANSDVADWWPGTVVEGGLLDPGRHFIVCANKLASPYGSTSPLSTNPLTGEPYYMDFPLVTPRDMARAYGRLRKALGISRIQMLIGSSTGGYQALEWAIEEPSLFENLALLVTMYRTSPWIVASSEAQRMALETDPTFRDRRPDAGGEGLAAARAMAMLIYRNADTYNTTQRDDEYKLHGFRAASYQRYQGEKLRRRFNAHCYYRLLQALDLHNVGRSRGGAEAALASITARTAVVAVDTDIMYLPKEIREMAGMIPGAAYHELHSDSGHAGFLIETPAITHILNMYLELGGGAVGAAFLHGTCGVSTD